VYAQNDPVNLLDRTGFKTVVVITRDSGFGSHVALWLTNNGSPILYDPGGSFLGSEGRGSGGFFTDEEANLEEYTRYQESTGSSVETFTFETTVAEEAQIAERISPSSGGPGEGEAGFLMCASHVSSVLQGTGPFNNLGTYRFPGNLASALERLRAGGNRPRLLQLRQLIPAPFPVSPFFR
jgi:hypothetical protein